MDEYQDWFHTVTGTQISIVTMCRSILRLGFTYKKVTLSSMNFLYFYKEALGNCNISFATVHRRVYLDVKLLLTAASALFGADIQLISYRFVRFCKSPAPGDFTFCSPILYLLFLFLS